VIERRLNWAYDTNIRLPKNQATLARLPNLFSSFTKSLECRNLRRLMNMEKEQIYKQTIEHFLGPIMHLMNDEGVSEILINGPNKIYFEKGGILQASEKQFDSPESLEAAINNIAEYVNKRVDSEHHSMDARLPPPWKSRVHVIVPPSSRDGVHVSIRKFREQKKEEPINLDFLVSKDSINKIVADFLNVCVQAHKNMVVSGGTGTGKTTLLNALSASIPEQERIVVIEDSSELQLAQPHTVYLEAQEAQPNGRGGVSMRDLFVDSLRMRPDRIVLGEVRRGEALDVIQSMISGHDGSLTTVHASSPRDAAIRLETLCMMAGLDMPVHVVRRQVSSAVHLVIQIARRSSGKRIVDSIAEILGLDDGGDYIVKSIFERTHDGNEEKPEGELAWTGHTPQFWKKLAKNSTFRNEMESLSFLTKVSTT